MKYESGQKTDTAMTGMALLAFVGAGYTEKVGRYKSTVQRAVAWLKSKQQANGLIFDPTDAGAHRGVGYPHAIAGMALVEAAGMARIPDTIRAAQKAVDYSCNVHQQGEEKDEYSRGAWRYEPKSKPDTSVSGWYVFQLKSAKMAGLSIPQGSFDGAIKYLDKVEHKEAATDAAYSAPSTYWYMEDKQFGHGTSHHRLSAIGNLARQFMGWKKDDLQASVDKFTRDGGVPTPGKVDLYYWYYGSMCAFQQQGPVWISWRDAMYKTLMESQRLGGDEDGSWNPEGEFHEEWGRVGQTALSCLCLEVIYRFALVNKIK